MLVDFAGVLVVDVATARCGLDDGSFMMWWLLREGVGDWCYCAGVAGFVINE
jgi:hypothetical protein